MGRLIDADELLTHIEDYGEGQYRLDLIAPYYVRNAPTVEVIPKDQYEARLKADMVAMLTEIQLEIREYHEIGCDEDCNHCRLMGCVEPVNVIKDLDIIQQKINSLKAESESQESKETDI